MKSHDSSRAWWRAFAAASLLLSCAGNVSAMNLNLACPWSDTCSPPQMPYLSFRSPQSENLLFAAGDTIELQCQAGLRSVGLRWTLHRNMIEKPFRNGTAEALPANRFLIRLATAGLPPGFYDVRVELDTGLSNLSNDALVKRPVSGICTFGWKADAMAVADTRPKNFKVFWDEAKAKQAAVPLDAREEPFRTFGPKEINDYNVTNACLPPDYDPTGHRAEQVESCKVSFAGPDGGRVYGWLAKPAGPGKFPAMLVLPGAGFSARPRPLEHARHGYVALDLQIHGQDADLKEYPQLPGYYGDLTFDPPSAYYYFNVHLRCLQAVNYLASRPDVDASRIVVVGGSQGGRLAAVVAGLDPRIKAAVVCIANSPNHPHLRWVARCNGYAELGDPKPDPAITPCDGMDVTGAPPVISDVVGNGFAFYDPMNYAPDIRCPVLFNAGLIDPVSPPFSIWAVFNRLGSEDKTLIAIDGHAHDWSAEFDRRAWRWLEARVGGHSGADVPAVALPQAAASGESTPSLVRSAAPDWPQWRGPRRDGISAETGLLQSWPEGGPKLLWKVSGVGRGYSSPIVAAGGIYITGDTDKELVISAFTLEGQPRWRTANGEPWKKSFPGARSSCCFDDGKLYHMNAHGNLVCLDAATGGVAWAVNVLERYEAKNIMWGICESVLAHGDRVFVTPAGAKGLMAALDKRTGAPVWSTPALDGEQASYSSPILIQAGKRKLLVNGGAKYVFAVDSETGGLVWQLPQADPKNTVNTTPVLSGRRLLFTNASREFGAVFGVQLGDGSATQVWSRELKIGHGGTVCVDGRLYGSSSRGDLRGWVAVDVENGSPAQMRPEGDLPDGSVIFADGRFYCLTMRGEMTLQELTDAGFRTAGKFRLAEGQDAWAHPVLCQGKLFLRYDDVLYCYDVRR